MAPMSSGPFPDPCIDRVHPARCRITEGNRAVNADPITVGVMVGGTRREERPAPFRLKMLTQALSPRRR